MTVAERDGRVRQSSSKKKLHGREFYESIGSPKMIIAPMVDRSEFAWRMLTRSFADPNASRPILAYTPMFHARLFREHPLYRQQHFEALRPDPTSDNTQSSEPAAPYLDGNPSLDRPLIVQFCANDPDDLLEAARHVEPYCDAVDLNLGCPQGIAKRGRYGAFLQEEPDLIYSLINRLHTNLSIPVTAKFRIRETRQETLEYARMLLSAGASILSVHGRMREQKGHNTGVADWGVIRYLRDNLPADTVLFANGNVLNAGDVWRCLDVTGADGVMSAEGNLSDPTIFAGMEAPPVEEEERKREYWRARDGKGGYRMDFVLRRYMDIIYEYVLGLEKPKRKPLFLPSDPVDDSTTQSPVEEGEAAAEKEEEDDGPPKKKQKRNKNKKPTSPNLVSIQGHLFQLLRPLISKKTNIRDALARSRGDDIPAFENVLSLVEQAVREGILEYEAHPERFETAAADADLTGSKATIAEYGRPWWVCQPYVRPLPEEAMQKGALMQKKKHRKKEQDDAVEVQCGDCDGPEKDGTTTATTGKENVSPEKLVNG